MQRIFQINGEKIKEKFVAKETLWMKRKCLRKFSMELGKLTIEQWSDNEVSFIYGGMNEKNCLLNTDI